MSSFLAPVERPSRLSMRLAYYVTRRQFGKVPQPISITSARMPFAFLMFSARIGRLDKKLRLPAPTAVLIRERVSEINGCLFCQDIGRWFALRQSPSNAKRLDALSEYRTSDLFTAAERAALDYASELTTNRHVAEETFAELARHYDERQICEIVWLVASEHYYNISNHGLNIGSDGLCELRERSLRR